MNGDVVAVLDAIEVPVVVVDLHFRIVRFNRAASEVFRLQSSDVGRHSCELHALEDIKDLEQKCHRAIVEREALQHEIRKGDRWFLLRIAPYSGSDSQVRGAVITFTNVTGFRATIGQAIYEREYTKAVLNTVIEPLVVLDHRLEVQSANRVFYEWFGVTRERSQGVPLSDLGGCDWKSSGLWESLTATVEGNSEFEISEVEFDFPVRGRRTILLDARPMRREGDALVLLAFRDITERRKSEHAVKESERRFREMVNALPAAIYTTDAQGCLTHHNPAAAVMSGRKPELGTDQWCVNWKLFHADGRAMRHDECPMAIALKERRAIRGAEAIAERPDGTRFWFEPFPTPLFDTEGNLTGGINMLLDITERKAAEAKLRDREAQLVSEAQALGKLNELSSRLWRAPTLRAGLDEMLAATIELLRADFGNVQMFDPSRGVLLIESQCGFERPFLDFFREVAAEDDSACGRALRTGERIIIEDVETDALYAPMREIARASGYRAVQSTPLIGRDGNPIGMLSTHFRHPHRPGEQSLRRLDLYVRQAVDFIERKRVEESLHRNQQDLASELDAVQRLQQVSLHLAHASDSQALYEHIMDAAVAIMRADCASMQMLQSERGIGGELRLLASRGFEAEAAKFWECVRADSGCTCGEALRTGTRSIAADVRTCEFMAGTDDRRTYLAAGMHAAQSTPLFSRNGKMVGMISTHWKRPHQPTERDLRLFDVLARQAADWLERLQAEEALRASEERFRKTLALMPAAVYSCDTTGVITYFNEQAAHLWGRAPRIGDTDERFCGSEQMILPDGTPLPHEKCPMASALAEGRSFRDTEVRIRRPDGSLVDVMVNIDPIRNEQGLIVGAINAFHDVSAIKRAEQALRESETRFRTLFESMDEGYCVIEMIFDEQDRPIDYRFLETNPVFEKQTGIKDAKGRLMREIAPDHEQHWFDIYGRIAKSGETLRFENLAAALGRYYDVCAFRVGPPELRRVGIIFNDITKRKRDEEALRSGEERYRSLVSVITDVPWTADSQGAFTSEQTAWAAYTGQTTPRSLGFGWADALHPDDRESVLAVWQQAREAKSLYESRGRLWHAATQTYRHFIARAAPLFNDDGTIREWVGSCTDVEEQHRAERALDKARELAEDANRAKDRFLAVLSHELRTPLSPVVMTVASWENDPDLPFELREDVAMIRRNIELEVRLIDDLLDLSRVTSGKMRLQIQPTPVHPLLRQAVLNCASDTSSKKLNMRLDLQANSDMVNADPARLQQIFWNLIRNAAKFTPEGGEIRICTEKLGERLRVEVRDTGVGIAPEFLPKIFDAFEQGDIKTARQFGGLGLGLAICKAVVDMHGGVIAAQSDGVGKGATFVVELPAMVTTEAKQPLSSQSSGPVESDHRFRVLLVDDHPDTLNVVARLLRGSGYVVETAGSVAAALQLAGTGCFDIVVSDLGLPDGTGYDLMSEIRRRHGIKGIALSGYGMEEDQRRSREAGFVDHVVKPVDLAQLEAVIDRVVAGD